MSPGHVTNLRLWGFGLPEVGAAAPWHGRGDCHRRAALIPRREMGRWANNRVENSHLPFRRRGRAMLRFRPMKSLQQFASVHASLHNHFASDRHLVDRQTIKRHRSVALAEWQSLAARDTTMQRDQLARWRHVRIRLMRWMAPVSNDGESYRGLLSKQPVQRTIHYGDYHDRP